MNEKIILFETNFWKVILIDDQAYLGRCCVYFKRDCRKLSDLTHDEWTDFHSNVVIKLENALKKTFKATMFNWTCLMNNAYKDKNPNPQVHWHFRPRYNHKVKFANQEFQDLEFAHHYSRERKFIVSDNVLKKISEKIKNCL